MKKLSSSLAMLAEIFEEVAEISKEGHRCFVIMLMEYKFKYTYSYKLIKTLVFLPFLMVLKEELEKSHTEKLSPDLNELKNDTNHAI